MTKFILSDNQELTHLALDTLLRRISGIPIYNATNKAELIDQLRQDSDAIIVIDFTMFDFNGVEDLLIVDERFTQARWVLISDSLTDELIRRVLYSSHDISVVFKDSSLSIIEGALEAAMHGSRYISQRATEMLLEQKSREEAPTPLTATEKEILRCIAQGKTTKDIAAERCSSVHTINTHRKNIFRKLGVNTAHDAVKYAFRAGLVDSSEFYI